MLLKKTDDALELRLSAAKKPVQAPFKLTVLVQEMVPIQLTNTHPLSIIDFVLLFPRDSGQERRRAFHFGYGDLSPTNSGTARGTGGWLSWMMLRKYRTQMDDVVESVIRRRFILHFWA